MSAHGQPIPLTARARGPLRGEAVIPGDKSVSHRALIFGALSLGETRIAGLLEGQDVLDTARAMAAFGAQVERTGEGAWSVRGVGVGGFAEPEDVIDCGNSGTGVRLIMGAMATTAISACFTGDASLRKRPMGRITEPLALFGAESRGRRGGRLPLVLTGAADPVPVSYRLPMASAQVKSAVLLAGLNAPGITEVIEPEATRDHTERMLAGFGATLESEALPEGGRRILLTGQPELTGRTLAVPRDPSSAAFPICAALIVEGSEVRLPGIAMNPTRTGLIATLQEMGADLALENAREEGGEPTADVVARFSALRGVEVPPERAPSMIDEYPVLAVAAAFAEGKTVMRGIGELRVKESDRIDAVARGLEACGVQVEETEDSLTVHGLGAGGMPGGGTVATHLDHRIAMSFLVGGLASRRPVSVDDGGPIATSFPDFRPLMARLGAEIGEMAPA
ncbi:3-phosphoshikimate 1-carboxyvinyltransferase [Albimonas pacifica]|uniref:3-phosphoshikimate 1-carboxyvinyltransferase n=1 Tax=Albimonas pacifica TaxID=1114924 RepID=A0A1I3MEY8_9RHOB|nr:3-phosphoshikimate 1-carboxyvinyltransferase [Albimonas pacifica]SFI95360.1 3-phosphoshikimate 1-carboxyvinyltransferase [Albimonas pacifica]